MAILLAAALLQQADPFVLRAASEWSKRRMWSAVVDNLVSHPRFAGPLESATHEGVAGTPGEGPHLRLWLRVEGEEIAFARYHTYGCPAAIASGEMLCLLLCGRPVEKARELSARDLTAALHGLPEGKEHCPCLAVEALHNALGGKTVGEASVRGTQR